MEYVMKSLIRVMLKPIGTEARDAKMVSKLLIFGGPLVGILSCGQLHSFVLTEWELFLGLLLLRFQLTQLFLDAVYAARECL